MVLIPVSLWAENNKKLLLKDNPDVPWHIRADRLAYDHKTRQYVGTGNVLITKENKKLTADMIRFDHLTMRVIASGHVMMAAGDDILSGSRMEVNLKTETGVIDDGSIFIKENHFHIKGDKIQKTGKHTYSAQNASLSACDGDVPAWKITGKNLNVTIEGYGTVSHAAFWVKKVPLMYMPFMIFPVKLRRQTGLLLPEPGYSERDGIEFHQPFYWAINDSSDATLYMHYLQNRGIKTGVEYRYVWDNRSKGTLMYDFLDDRQQDDGTPDAVEDWGYDDDEVSRPNTDRYWFRMKLDQALPYGIFGKADIDIVSDQDYLRDFKSGYTGFDDTEEYFYEAFAREIDDYTDTIRTNKLVLGKILPRASLNTGLIWCDNVINRRWNDTDNTLHKLPFVEFDTLSQPVLHTPLRWKLDSEYVHFYREDGTRGQRGDLFSEISLPIRIRNYVSLESSLGLRETLWHIDEYEDAASEDDNTLHREMYDVNISASTNLFRTYDFKTLFGMPGTRIRHTIRPELAYEYVPDREQDEYPGFDSLDQIDKKNQLTASVTSAVISSPIFGESADTDTYHQFCRLKLEQGYDLANETDSETDERRPFSPLYGEIEFIPGEFLNLQTYAQWNYYENEFPSWNASANLQDSRGDTLSMEYRYTQNSNETFYTDMILKLSENFSLYADYERNLYECKDISSRMGITYTAQCWAADVRYTDEENDHKYTFKINLYGLEGAERKNDSR